MDINKCSVYREYSDALNHRNKLYNLAIKMQNLDIDSKRYLRIIELCKEADIRFEKACNAHLEKYPECNIQLR